MLAIGDAAIDAKRRAPVEGVDQGSAQYNPFHALKRFLDDGRCPS